MRTRAVFLALCLVMTVPTSAAATDAAGSLGHHTRLGRARLNVQRARFTAKSSTTCRGYPTSPVTISGNSKNNTIHGTNGDDVISGGGGNDKIFGGGGDDIICGGDGNDKVMGEDGADSIGGGPGNDKLIGGAENDYFLGEPGDDTITGGDGTQDRIDYLFAKKGIKFNFGSGKATKGADDTFSGIEYVDSTDFNDVLIGGPDADFFAPHGGNDSVTGGEGNDSVVYMLTPNPVVVDLSKGKVTGEGTDTLSGVESVDGSNFNDTITGDDESNTLYGFEGDDTIVGGAGFDYLSGDEGNDSLDGGADADVAYYQYASTGVDVSLTRGNGGGGDQGTDTYQNIEGVYGSFFDDILEGDNGSNFFYGGAGNDTMDGKAGLDLAWYLEVGPVTANLQTNTATGDGSDTYKGMEGVSGSIFDDTIIGNDEDNYLDGSLGNDTLTGNGGDDYFTPGLGDDTVNGGTGTYDMIDFFADAAMNVNLVQGTAFGEGSDGISGIEGVGTVDQPDTIVGDDNVNYLFSWGGADNVSGGGGNDEIDGGALDDTIDGGAGTDDCAPPVTGDVPDTHVTNCEGTNSVKIHPLFDFSNTTQRVRAH